MGLQDTVNNLKAELDKSDRGMRKFQRQVRACKLKCGFYLKLIIFS